MPPTDGLTACSSNKLCAEDLDPSNRMIGLPSLRGDRNQARDNLTPTTTVGVDTAAHTLFHNILDSQSSNSGAIGLRFRQPRLGPEELLVQEFIRDLRVHIPVGYRLTLFKEPGIESGFPDLVIVVWDWQTAEAWNPSRRFLTNYDFRVIHYLSQSGQCSRRTLLGVFGPRVRSSIERLEAAEMISACGDMIAPADWSSLYATKHIIAVEAKVSQWRQALNQAFQNQWFATSSFVLLSRLPGGVALADEAEALGVGLWTMANNVLDLSAMAQHRQPSSYASWLFNEWAWRAAIVQLEE